MKQKHVLSILAAVALLASLHCGGTSAQKPPAQPTSPNTVAGVTAPLWVNAGDAYCRQQGMLGFCAVGSVQGVRNYSLARETAGNRARSEMQKVLRTYCSSLAKDYQASITAGDMSASDEQQMVEVAGKLFTAGEQYGVKIIDYWEHPTNGTIFALAHLDLVGLQESVQQMKDLGEKVKDHVRQNAERLFGELEKEEAKAAK